MTGLVTVLISSTTSTAARHRYGGCSTYTFDGFTVDLSAVSFTIFGTIFQCREFDASQSVTSSSASGNNTLNGNDGDDVINGGAGGDTLNGGNGNDTITDSSATGP